MTDHTTVPNPFPGLKRWPFVLALVCGTSLQAADTNSPAPTLGQVREEMAGVRTVFTRFVQERHLSLFDEPLRSEGFLSCEKPGHLRWETVTPYRSILVSDGSHVSQFEWMEGRWKKLDLGLAEAMKRVVAQIASVVEGGYAADQDDFESSIQTTPEGPVVTLVPRHEKMRKVLLQVEVHLQPDLKGTRQVILREDGGDQTEIRFEDQVTNIDFPEGTFDTLNPVAIERVQEAAAKSGP